MRKIVGFFLMSVMSAAWADDNIAIYMELLSYHATQKSLLAKSRMSPQPAVPREVIERLAPDQLAAHLRKYVPEYLSYRNRLQRAREDYGKLKRRLNDLPVSHFEERSKLEVAIVADKKLIDEIPKSIFSMSLDANEKLQNSLKTLRPDQRVVQKSTPGARPKLPGTFGGSYDERLKQAAEEKIFLTPVDDAFYETQLGKKVERDLGGRAEYWSYDYDKNELYVRVKGDTGRVRVIKDQGSVRTIQTRSGADFTNVYKDEVVDLFKAKGRFLTGNKDDESLFGEMPKNKGPDVLNERLPPGHTHDDGHDHRHD